MSIRNLPSSPVSVRHSSPLRVTLLLALPVLISGCAKFPKWNLPFAEPTPTYKAQYGLTPAQKVNQLRNLAQSARSFTPEKQTDFSGELYQNYSKTRDPILRREMVRTLGAFSVPTAAAGLQAAIEDDDPLVRTAACEAWGQRQGPEAIAALAGLLRNDPDVDVRLAAASALATFKSPIAVQELASVLEDRDPAIQLAAIDALRTTTGQDLGSNINQWSEYVRKTLPAGQLDAPSDPEMIAQPTDSLFLR